VFSLPWFDLLEMNDQQLKIKQFLIEVTREIF